MQENIIATLREQHQNLAAMLGEIKDLSSRENPDSQAIVEGLGKFKAAVLDHLSLEDNTFYPVFFEEMKKDLRDVTELKNLYGEMKNIAEQVVSFLASYDDSRKVEEGMDNFKTGLDNIIQVLSLRIEREDYFVFSVYEKLASLRPA